MQPQEGAPLVSMAQSQVQKQVETFKGQEEHKQTNKQKEEEERTYLTQHSKYFSFIMCSKIVR